MTCVKFEARRRWCVASAALVVCGLWSCASNKEGIPARPDFATVVNVKKSRDFLEDKNVIYNKQQFVDKSSVPGFLAVRENGVAGCPRQMDVGMNVWTAQGVHGWFGFGGARIDAPQMQRIYAQIYKGLPSTLINVPGRSGAMSEVVLVSPVDSELAVEVERQLNTLGHGYRIMPTYIDPQNKNYFYSLVCSGNPEKAWAGDRAGEDRREQARAACSVDFVLSQDLACLASGRRLPMAISPDGRATADTKAIPLLFKSQ